jgi:hypothetical protein
VVGGRRRHPAWGALLAVLGLTLLWWTGITAGQYMPAWGEAEPRCVLVGQCSTAEVEATLRNLWSAALAGVVVVLVGVLLGTRSLSRERPEPTSSPRTVLAHAAVAGLVGGVLAGVLVVPALASVFFAPHAVAGAVLGVWLVPSAALAAVDRAFDGASAQRAWLTALALTPTAAVCTGGLLWLVPLPVASTATIGVAFGAVVAAGVALLRTRRGPAAAGERAGVRGDGARLLVAVLVVVSVVAAVAGVQALGQRLARDLRPDPPVAAPPPVPTDPVEPLPAPAPTPTVPPLAPVEAAEPCAMEDLSLAVGGFDAAMGARAASLQATNVSATPCWVEGVPAVNLLQGGRPLDLAVGPGQAPTGGPAAAQRVGLAPTGSAYTLLTWRTYAGWADAETSQTVTAALDPAGPPVEVPITADFGPAPFDIADGGEWGIAPWAPPWN